MDISQALEYIKQLYLMYIQPHMGTIVKVALAVIIIIILLRIFLPMIWENILVGVVKLSDKNKNEKDDE
ncbi:MAG: hypothetical protein ACI4JF_10330 [Oscillospiraceae bacterium]